MITAVVELPTVLDFHLAADAVAFALFKRVEIRGAQHPEATIAVQAAPHHQPVPRLEHVQCLRLEHQQHPSSDELQRQDDRGKVHYLAWENAVGDEQRHDSRLQLDLLDILPRPFGGLIGEVLHQDMLQARRDRVALGTARKAGSGEDPFQELGWAWRCFTSHSESCGTPGSGSCGPSRGASSRGKSYALRKQIPPAISTNISVLPGQ